jgi:putative endonuclease
LDPGLGSSCGSNLIQRIWQHKNLQVPGFTERYDTHLLVYHEPHATMEHAILREKRLKKWERRWKLRLINEFNPEWRDLWPAIPGALDPRLREDDGPRQG